MNNYVLVGRLTDKGTLKEGRKGKYCRVTIAITRPFKNDEGMYDTDFIKVTLRKELATKLHEWCEKGDLLGLKGRMESTSKHNTILVAEKLTFLKTKQALQDKELYQYE